MAKDMQDIYLIGPFNVYLLKDFITQFNSVTSKKVQLIIDSPGGDSQVLYTITDMLLANFKRENIETLVLGCAYSAGFLLSQLALPGKRRCHSHSLLMIHECFLQEVESNEDGLTAESDFAQFIMQRAHEYCMKYVATQDKYYTPTDTYFTADGALKSNVIDEIVGARAITDTLES